MDEFDVYDQRLPVRQGPPTDAVTVFEDTVHEDTAADGSSRSRDAGLDRVEADKSAVVTAVPTDFAPGTSAPTIPLRSSSFCTNRLCSTDCFAMDEFEPSDQLSSVWTDPPTDAVPVFDDMAHDNSAAGGGSRSCYAGLDRFEADDFDGEAAVRNDFAPALPAPTTAGLDAGVTIPVRTGQVPDATPTGRAAAVNDDDNANDDPFADLLAPVQRPARASPGGAYQQRVPGTLPGPTTDMTLEQHLKERTQKMIDPKPRGAAVLINPEPRCAAVRPEERFLDDLYAMVRDARQFHHDGLDSVADIMRDLIRDIVRDSDLNATEQSSVLGAFISLSYRPFEDNAGTELPIVKAEVSPTPTVRAQSHHREEPTDLLSVVLRPAGATPGGVSNLRATAADAVGADTLRGSRPQVHASPVGVVAADALDGGVDAVRRAQDGNHYSDAGAGRLRASAGTLIADEHRIDNSPRTPAGVQEAQQIVMPDRHRYDQQIPRPAKILPGGTLQPRVPGALPGHASNPTPDALCTEASQSPTVGDSDHGRGEPTSMPPVGIRAIVISNGGATDNQRPPAGVQEVQTMATCDRHHHDNPPIQLSSDGKYIPPVYAGTPVRMPTVGPPTGGDDFAETAPAAATLPAVPRQIMPFPEATGATDGTPAGTALGQSPQRVFVVCLLDMPLPDALDGIQVLLAELDVGPVLWGSPGVVEQLQTFPHHIRERQRRQHDLVVSLLETDAYTVMCASAQWHLSDRSPSTRSKSTEAHASYLLANLLSNLAFASPAQHVRGLKSGHSLRAYDPGGHCRAGCRQDRRNIATTVRLARDYKNDFVNIKSLSNKDTMMAWCPHLWIGTRD
jgi:hypothetical protein